MVHCRRAIVDAIFYVVDNGIKWRALPADFPLWSTVYNYFATGEKAGAPKRSADPVVVRDYERLPEHHAAMVRWTMIRVTTKRLTNRFRNGL